MSQNGVPARIIYPYSLPVFLKIIFMYHVHFLFFFFFIYINNDVQLNKLAQTVVFETRIREVPGSDPVAGQSDWDVSWFPSVTKENVGLEIYMP